MFEIIMALVSSSGFGAVLGAVNGFLQRIEERKNLALRLGHEQIMAQKEFERGRVEHAEEIEMLSESTALRIEELEGEAFVESQKTESSWAMTIKAFVRPVILIYLLTMTTVVALALNTLVGGLKGLETGEVMELYRACVFMVLSLTSMGVSWYFAQRTSKQFDTMLASISTRYTR